MSILLRVLSIFKVLLLS